MLDDVQKHPAPRPIGKEFLNTLSVLGQAILLISLPFGILNFVLPIYGKEIGADAVQIGLFFSAFSLMTVLLRPLVGAGLDRYGRRPFFLAGLAGYAATMFAFAFSDQVWGIVLARTVQGTASAFLWLAARAITADVAGADDRARSFGRVDQSANRGGILGTFIGFGVLFPLGIACGAISAAGHGRPVQSVRHRLAVVAGGRDTGRAVPMAATARDAGGAGGAAAVSEMEEVGVG